MQAWNEHWWTTVASDSDTEPYIRQLRAIFPVAAYRPILTGAVVAFSLVAALLEGIGIGFLLPIVEVAQSNDDPSGPVRVLAEIYSAVGVPFELGYIVAGVAVIIGIRYLMTFLAGWLTAILRMTYIRDLRTRAFEATLDARIAYFDETGADEMLNALLTQTTHASEAIHRLVVLLKVLLVSLAYLSIALYVAPYLMLGTGLVLGGFMMAVRYVFESGYSVGNRVADANEQLQETIQAGIQGIRDVKLLNAADIHLSEYRTAVDNYTASMIDRRRNQEAIRSLNYFATAVFVFLLLYVGLTVRDLSLGGLSVFLFAMFRLGPNLSHMNTLLYELETDLPHLVRTQDFVTELTANLEKDTGRPLTDPVETIRFDDVSFRYEGDGETVLDGVSFAVDRGEFVAFAGPSGAGKSTIIALIARFYEATDGTITADGTPISAFALSDWRDRLAVVRQDPHIFNESLYFNVAIGDPDATRDEIEWACDVAAVTEFVDELPEGYETNLGDDGVRLSGGQQQRIAIARALLQDADVLLLDEATSDLDGALEETVYEGLEGIERDHAVITVTHRLATVTAATAIHILDDGQIVESGTHDELLRANGTYADLLETQRTTAPN